MGHILRDIATRYCDAIAATPRKQRSPKMVRYPRWAPSFTQAHLCDTPFCHISRENCAMTTPPLSETRNSFAILSLQVSPDMESIAVGPPRSGFQMKLVSEIICLILHGGKNPCLFCSVFLAFRSQHTSQRKEDQDPCAKLCEHQSQNGHAKLPW